jgi:poly(3-hydroxyalkanoate) synthetase
MISWRNPDEAQAHFDLDTYGARGTIQRKNND